MPSQQVEQIRQQFYASVGINENTPISDADAANLIDQWEQYLYIAAQQVGRQQAPPVRPGVPNVSYVPPGQRYNPGQIYNVGGGTYVGPPQPGTVYRPPAPYGTNQARPGMVQPPRVQPGGGTVNFGPPPPR